MSFTMVPVGLRMRLRERKLRAAGAARPAEQR